MLLILYLTAQSQVYNTVLKRLIGKVKYSYYGNKLSKNKNSVKQTWPNFNELIGKKSHLNLLECIFRITRKSQKVKTLLNVLILVVLEIQWPDLLPAMDPVLLINILILNTIKH